MRYEPGASELVLIEEPQNADVPAAITGAGALGKRGSIGVAGRDLHWPPPAEMANPTPTSPAAALTCASARRFVPWTTFVSSPTGSTSWRSRLPLFAGVVDQVGAENALSFPLGAEAVTT